ncbi:hypothetical protein [Parafilimonas terrae]|jgi:hypothetical protein|uniref:Lipocalin-like domain-containing protein n=1 Tax=Parafilimonas terrae TaxID=1465490 RepID=A0A1I5V031_9BACT|nr:hypothetical protein [Parafilimonas terrae]SFQ00873.1 hypothetical protein SAMN05444277_104134 [Parafilimonas terrae]
MKLKLYLLLLFISFYTLSCQKELIKTTTTTPPPVTDTTGTNNDGDTSIDNSIVGTWQFVSMEAKTKSSSETITGNINQRVETFLDYLSTDNAGSIVISDTSMNCTGLTYKVSSTIKTYRYHNNVLLDSLFTPYETTFPATDSYTPYWMTTEDSIFFRKGGFSNVSGSKYQVKSSAAKLDLKGDVLTFIQPIKKDTVENIAGIDQHTIISGIAIIKLSRQRQ